MMFRNILRSATTHSRFSSRNRVFQSHDLVKAQEASELRLAKAQESLKVDLSKAQESLKVDLASAHAKSEAGYKAFIKQDRATLLIQVLASVATGTGLGISFFSWSGFEVISPWHKASM